jgi:EAL domain-containing protein (putative c-di-GMP-specific phosphodiesterase class I)
MTGKGANHMLGKTSADLYPSDYVDAIAMDDFGTGYSSLSYLARLPIDALKIDRSFVSAITENQDDAAIASAIISMAQALGLNTIAEGVETQAQFDLLRTLGCQQIQGYLISRSVPEEEILKMLRRP